MIPMVAFTPESGERPMASTTWPGRSVSVEPKVAAGAPFSASFSTARSVPESRPASVAEVVRPSGSVIPISSRRRMACSAVTMTPGRQMTPLEAKRGRAFTATTVRPAFSTAPANSLDKATNSFSMLPACRMPRARRTGKSGRGGLEEWLAAPGMAAATLVFVEEYLSTSYDPDCDYVDGELEGRNVGEKRPQQSTGKHLHLFANGLSHPVHLNRTAFARVGYTLPCTRRLCLDWRARRGSAHPAALLVHRNPLAGGRRRTNPAKSRRSPQNGRPVHLGHRTASARRLSIRLRAPMWLKTGSFAPATPTSPCRSPKSGKNYGRPAEGRHELPAATSEHKGHLSFITGQSPYLLLVRAFQGAASIGSQPPN